MRETHRAPKNEAEVSLRTCLGLGLWQSLAATRSGLGVAKAKARLGLVLLPLFAALTFFQPRRLRR